MILTLLLAFVVQITFAQEKTISGTVSDELGPVTDVSVKVKGTEIGTVTDFDGNYSIKAKFGDMIEFSHISYQDTTKTVGELSTLNVIISSSGVGLDEVVITGYGGITTQRDLTTNVSKVNVEDVKSISTSNIANALQGTVSGLQISSSSGAPGGEVSVSIRGASTINGSSTPLYVIDGIVMFTGSTVSNSFGGQQNSALSNLNSDDIESITVLKDAASTAVYGNRGANGVVLIRTKRGKSGKTKVTISSTTGFQNQIEKLKTMNYGQWLNYRDVSAENAGAISGSVSASAGTGVGDPSLAGASQEVLSAFYLSQANVGDNYLDQAYVDNAILTNNNFNFSGGNDKGTFYLGVSHFFQEGTLLTQDFERKNVRLNVTQKLSDKFDFSGGVSLTDEFINQIVSDNNIFGVLSTAVLEAPGNTIFDESGNFTDYTDFIFSNPIQNAVEDFGKGRTFRILGNANLGYKLNDDFSFKSTFGFDQSNYIERLFNPATTAQGNFGVVDPLDPGLAQEDHVTRRTYTALQSMSYNKTFGNVKFRAYLAGEFENATTRFLRAGSEGFPNAGLTFVGQGTTPTTTTGFFSEEKRTSFISRFGTTIKNNLILEASYRRDASSKLNKVNRDGDFYGASAAYIVSGASWFKSEFFNYLKVRASWGIVGNDTAFGRFTAPVVNLGLYAEESTLFLTEGAPNARWEETEQLDFGFNTRFFNNKITLDYSYYNKTTNDNSLVLPVPLTPSQGAGNTPTNIAEIENIGHEISLNLKVIDKDDFTWNANFNFSTLDVEVTSIGDTPVIDAGFVNRIDAGQPLSYFYILEADGLYQTLDEVPANLQLNGVGPGDVKYIDQNGDGEITDEDRINGGNPWADFTLNWKNNLRYKNVDLSFLWAMSEGNDVFNSTLRFAGISGGLNFNKFTNQLDYWTPTNTTATLPRPNDQTRTHNNQESTRFSEDGSYIKLRNITLGYTFPNIKGIDKLRFSISADNVILITDYTGVDPEVNFTGNTNLTRGTDFLTQGNTQTWKFGINLSF